MIAIISAGKTSILRVIYDIDFLQVSAGISTKFVTIIRYNQSIGNNPKFYHLKLQRSAIGYDFYKEPNTEILGKENIKKANEKINEELKKTKYFLFRFVLYG